MIWDIKAITKLAELIGVAAPGTVAGVIVSSFNPG
jgi:hypothetical protein